ncbi:MAG: hypothetical protein Q7U52_16930 [Hydrogenophaga sp.]|uniref:hypothetical protein n=1 Tax=Hydrogenophaga sp. TaxID=1904254 RepID=UPI00271F12F2|nr:hypothetical protein [Hydrogenophaga sp.]MDO9149311.1 hypothetical protein [Hydrogenophaga sp.]MDO9603060.1 hypothetical protein [Hydrogenophaga sp.]MDP2165055.1 hypothetical protein [Hydrogenophaga sp.]MDP3476795.1 hypothetical protein [Hydrogenophaga sp.]
MEPDADSVFAHADLTLKVNLETAVGRARVGCQAVCWQGATTPLAAASKKEQPGQRTAWRLNRVCSAFTRKVSAAVVKIVHVHGTFQRKERGQLPFLGSRNLSQPNRPLLRPVSDSGHLPALGIRRGPHRCADALGRPLHRLTRETVTGPGHVLPLRAPMSEAAARIAVQVGAAWLEKSPGGKGVLPGGGHIAAPARVVVLGMPCRWPRT